MTTPRRIFHRSWIQFAALLLFYPLGVLLVWISPSRSRAVKTWLSLGFLPVFVAQLYVTFAVGPQGAKTYVKRTIVWWHDRQVDSQRTAQHDGTSLSLALRTATRTDDWPSFRGAGRDGVVTQGPHNLPWPDEGPKLLWEQLVGGGHGSVAVASQRIFTLEQRRDSEAVTCFDLETGRQLWAHFYPALFEAQGGPGPRSTPTVADSRVYAQGATGTLNCLDAKTGQPIWTRNILVDADAQNLQWGIASSPLVHCGLVYAVPGGPKASVIAYAQDSGEIVWTSGQHPAGYSSPVITTVLGQTQLVVFDGHGLTAYDPEEGRILWDYPWETDFGVNAAQPIFLENDQIFISSGYSSGCALLQIEYQENQMSARVVWSNKNLKLKFASAVRYQDSIFGPDNAVFMCLDWQTGKRRWKKGRYGFCHVILAHPYLVIQCENGDLALLEVNAEKLHEISRVPGLEGECRQPPVIAEGKLIVRNHRRMRCYDLTPKGS